MFGVMGLLLPANLAHPGPGQAMVYNPKFTVHLLPKVCVTRGLIWPPAVRSCESTFLSGTFLYPDGARGWRIKLNNSKGEIEV